MLTLLGNISFHSILQVRLLIYFPVKTHLPLTFSTLYSEVVFCSFFLWYNYFFIFRFFFDTFIPVDTQRRFTVDTGGLQVIKKRLWHRCFPVNFTKFLRTPFLTEHLWWLLLFLYQRLGILHLNNSIVVSSIFLRKRLKKQNWMRRVTPGMGKCFYLIIQVYF